jgi:hypothetical protein
LLHCPLLLQRQAVVCRCGCDGPLHLWNSSMS